MVMKTLECIFALLLGFLACNAFVLPQEKETDLPPCSSDPKGAFLDVIVMIDNSANMGAANLRKIYTTLSLAFSGFPIGNNWDITTGRKNTRVSVITYADQATIVANYTNINSIKDLSNTLNSVQISNSQTANIYDAFVKAFYMDTNCTQVFNCSVCYDDRRPTAFLLFAASSNTPNMDELLNIVQTVDFFDDGTFITLNFNPSDSTLNMLLNEFTKNTYVNATMYNFLGTDSNLGKDITWSLTQANCYCGDIGGINNVFFDKTNNRYARSRECFFLDDWIGGQPNDTVDMCSWTGLQIIPAFILSKEKTLSMQRIYPNNYPFYIGLHQNAQGNWSWYDYNLNEFPVSGYTDWDKGQPSTGACGILDSDDGVNFVWKSYGCNTDQTGLNMVFCQGLACDASSFSCCADCNGGETESCTMDFMQKKKNKLIKKTKRVNGKKIRVY